MSVLGGTARNPLGWENSLGHGRCFPGVGGGTVPLLLCAPSSEKSAASIRGAAPPLLPWPLRGGQVSRA